jgi:hypothetical protein
MPKPLIINGILAKITLAEPEKTPRKPKPRPAKS